MKIATFNPLACGKLEEALAALAAGAGLTLTSDQDAAALVIIRSLPPGATIKDFIEACNQHAASKLRVSQETLEAMKPLLVALESAGPWRAADAR
jgi:hypothetical protein